MTQRLNIAVLGAGAMGGYLAGFLAMAGHRVSVAARGAHGRAIAERGLVVGDQDGNELEPLRLTVLQPGDQDPARCDLAIFSAKAHQLAQLARQHAALLSDAGAILFIQNGFPWWYFLDRHTGDAEQLGSRLDPDGYLRSAFAGRPLFAALAFKAAEVIEPGRVRHIARQTDRFPLGAVQAGDTEDTEALARRLVGAGIPAEPVDDIRHEVWLKLMGNVPFNPVCAITRSPVGAVVANPHSRAVVEALIDETIALAAHFGHDISAGRQWRLQRAGDVGAARPSMLQDLDAGRPMEIDAILGALVDLAEREAVDIPTIRAMFGCLSLLDAEFCRSKGVNKRDSAVPEH